MLLAASSARTCVTEASQLKGAASGGSCEKPGTGGLVDKTTLDAATGIITVTGTDDTKAQVITLTPKWSATANSVTWACTSSKPEYAPQSCGAAAAPAPAPNP
ncbi:pilin [Aromatoleum anaerobium]|nr:pilin [Aromatoleum anaerobium]